MILLLLACLFITSFTAYRVYQYELDNYQQKMEKQASLYEAQYKQALNNHLERLDGLRNFYLTSNYVDRYDFQIYTHTILSNHSDIESIAWAPRISHIERIIHEQQIRDDGFSHYMIYQYDQHNNKQPADSTREYFPAAYIEPLHQNNTRLGFNFASRPDFQRIMEQSRDSGLPVASELFFREEKNEQYRFIIFVPVYNSIEPLYKIESRRQRLRGFITAQFPLNTVFSLAAPLLEKARFEISITDITPGFSDNSHFINIPLLSSFNSNNNIQSRKPEQAFFSHTAQLNFAGRIWKLRFDEYSLNLSERPGIQSVILFTAGILFTLFIAAYVIGSSQRRITIENLVKRRTSELKATKDKLEQILTNTVEGIYGVDLQGRTVFANSAALEMTGFTAEEMIDQPQHALIHHHYPDGSVYPREHCNIYAAFSKGKTTTSDKEVFWHKDGHSIPIEYTATPIYDEDKNIKGAVVVFRDISERKKYEAEIIDARYRAEEASRTKSEFLATMSHEIRTPMNGLLGMAQLLAATPLNNEQKEYVDTMMQSGDVLLHQINDVLDFSRIESGRMQLEPHAFDLYELCLQLIQLMNNRAMSKGLLLQLEYADTTPRLVIGDSLRIRQILLNLVNNAIKFTEEGHVDINVECLSHDTDTAKLHIEIVDTGIGIDTDQFNQIFDPFTQADASTTRRYGGSGLGLAICKRLADLMHANLGLSSIIGQGSVFWLEVELPITDTTTADSTYTVTTDKLIFSGKALLVEDNYVNTIVAKNMLSSLGFTVTLAENGKIAVERFLQDNFDVILMDCRMPVMDGYTATEMIREYNKDIPILAITANILPEDVNRCIQSGMNACLHKPLKLMPLQNELKNRLPFKHDSHASSPISTQPITPRELSIDTDHLDRLRKMMGDIFEELIPSYIEGSDKMFEEMPELIRQQDTITLERYAHSLKSSSQNVGANSLTTMAEHMENILRDKSLQIFEEEFPQFHESYNRIREKLLQYQISTEKKIQNNN
ncbi:MAG TPA: CHASE domain-containing protein [Gammaproteobacteria bacterium]